MRKLELIKGLSYSTMKLTAKKAVPFVVEDVLAEKLMETGRFKELEVVPDFQNSGAKSMEKMTKQELEKLAVENGIDISTCKNNTERAEAIKSSLEDGCKIENTVEEMSDEELAVYAVEREINVSICASRDEVIAAISTALAMQ